MSTGPFCDPTWPLTRRKILTRPDQLLMTPKVKFLNYSINSLNSVKNLYPTRHGPLWDVTIAGPPRCPVWCLLVTVHCGNTQNGGTVLPIANLVADSELVSPVSYSSFLVIICLSHLVSEMWQTDRQTDNANSHPQKKSWHCGGLANNVKITYTRMYKYSWWQQKAKLSIVNWTL